MLCVGRAAAFVVDVSVAVETASALPMSAPRPVASFVDVGSVPGSLLVVAAGLVRLVFLVVSTAVRVLIVVRLLVSLVSDEVVNVMLAVVFVSVVVMLAVVSVWVTVDSVTELDEDVTTRLVLEAAADVVLLDDFLPSVFRVLVVVESRAFPVGALVTVEVVLALPPAFVVVLLFGALVCVGPAVELDGNLLLDLETVTDVVLLVIEFRASHDEFCSAFRVLVVVTRLVLLADTLVIVEVVLNVLLDLVVLLLSEAFVCAGPIVEVGESAAEVVNEVVLVELREEVLRADDGAAGTSVVFVREAVVVEANGSLVAGSC